MSGIFEDRSRVKGNSSDIVRRKLDTSGQDKLTKTIKDNFVKAETDSLEREISTLLFDS
jgi:hypothetical protein